MVKPTPPTAPEAPLRSDAAFAAKAQTFLTWLSGGFYSYVGDAVDFVDERADEALAAATTFGFPSIAGKALNLTRVNAAGDALEFRTPAQVRSDLGIATDRIAQGTLSGSELIIAIPSEFEGIELSHWNYQPSTNGTALRMSIGSGTIGSPTWGANHYEQVQSVVLTTYTPGNVGPLGYVNLSFDQMGAGQVPGSGRAVANGFNTVSPVYGDAVRRGVIGGPQRATSHGSFGEESSVVHTLIRIFVSAGTMTGNYRLLGYRKP
jgi:hypothetical protein